jgi:hypothetical protein
LTKIENDRFTPAVLSPEISDYLIHLKVQHPNDDSEFSKFVIWLPYDAIQNELLKQLLPENLRQTILECRKEHDELQIKKETEIAASNFDNAREYRDRQEQLALQIRGAIANQERVVTPKLIDSVLKLLGYKS